MNMNTKRWVDNKWRYTALFSLWFMEFECNEGKGRKMTLRYKICLFDVKLFENDGINVDRAEL